MARILKIENGFHPPKIDRKKFWMIVGGVVLLLLLLLNSSIFSLKTVKLEGNQRVSQEAILEDLDLEMGDNLFRYMLTHWNFEPVVDPRLSEMDIYIEWPSTIRIVVDESMTIGYVYHQGTYLCIDRKGQVAASTHTLDEDLPVIRGLKVGDFMLGESLDTTDTERYEAVVSVCTILKKHELSTVIKKVNVLALDDIILYTDDMDIHCGTMEDMEQKINAIAAILQEKDLPKGILHIEDLDQQVYIEPGKD